MLPVPAHPPPFRPADVRHSSVQFWSRLHHIIQRLLLQSHLLGSSGCSRLLCCCLGKRQFSTVSSPAPGVLLLASIPPPLQLRSPAPAPHAPALRRPQRPTRTPSQVLIPSTSTGCMLLNQPTAATGPRRPRASTGTRFVSPVRVVSVRVHVRVHAPVFGAPVAPVYAPAACVPPPPSPRSPRARGPPAARPARPQARTFLSYQRHPRPHQLPG